MPELSVIVPVYNAEQYLEQCIGSILGQTYIDFELILVNDGSTDNSLQICNLYSQKDSRVRVFSKENGGSTSARKYGIMQAIGEYVTFVDADDWIEKDYYWEAFSLINQYHPDIMVCGYKQGSDGNYSCCSNHIDSGYYEKESLNKIYNQLLYTGDFYEAGVIPAPWNKIFKRMLVTPFQLKVPDSIRMGDDAAFTYPAILEADSILIKNEIQKYFYRYVPDSLSRSYDEKYFDRLQEFYDMLDFDIKEKSFVVWKQLQYYWAFMILLGCSQCLGRMRQKGYRSIVRELKNIISEHAMFRNISCRDLDVSLGGQKREIEYLMKENVFLYMVVHYKNILLKKRS